MSDDTTKRGPQDRVRINMNEAYEVRYWTQRLGISEERLATAVNEVGSSVAMVEKYLQESRGKVDR